MKNKGENGMKNFNQRLMEARKNNKGKFERAKEDAKKVVDSAEHCIIMATDNRAVVTGNNVDIGAAVGMLLECLMTKGTLTKEEIIELLDIVDKNVNAKNDEKINKEDLDKVIKKLEELNKMLERLDV